jgi:hypothetical protein
MANAAVIFAPSWLWKPCWRPACLIRTGPGPRRHILATSSSARPAIPSSTRTWTSMRPGNHRHGGLFRLRQRTVKSSICVDHGNLNNCQEIATARQMVKWPAVAKREDVKHFLLPPPTARHFEKWRPVPNSRGKPRILAMSRRYGALGSLVGAGSSGFFNWTLTSIRSLVPMTRRT